MRQLQQSHVLSSHIRAHLLHVELLVFLPSNVLLNRSRISNRTVADIAVKAGNFTHVMLDSKSLLLLLQRDILILPPPPRFNMLP